MLGCPWYGPDFELALPKNSPLFSAVLHSTPSHLVTQNLTRRGKEIQMSAVCQSPLIIHGERQKVLCVWRARGNRAPNQSSALLLEPICHWGKKSPTVSLKGVVSFDHLLHFLSAFEMAEASVVRIPNWSSFSPINASRLVILPKDHERSLQSTCQQLTVVVVTILRSDLCACVFFSLLLLTNSCRQLYPTACYPNFLTKEISGACLATDFAEGTNSYGRLAYGRKPQMTKTLSQTSASVMFYLMLYSIVDLCV